MTEKTKLILALLQIENLTKLLTGNEYETHFILHLTSIQVELNRQLTNLSQSSKIKE